MPPATSQVRVLESSIESPKEEPPVPGRNGEMTKTLKVAGGERLCDCRILVWIAPFRSA